MPERFYRGMKATEAMGQLNGLNSDVQAVKDATVAGVASAAQSAVQAAAARDAALQAWGASTAPAERLAAISRSVHKGTVVDVFLYDTTRDSDGGAWRLRCRHTSWENEALVPGKWLGLLPDPWTPAFAAAGGAVGDYFQYAANGAFYKLINGATFATTEVHRGNVREFPALAVIVVEASKLVIYDATKPDLPMWMVFNNANAPWNQLLLSTPGLKHVCALNGSLYIGSTDGVRKVDFISDNGYAWTVAGGYGGKDQAPLANRNTAVGHTFYDNYPAAALPIIPHSTINGVAATVLPDASIDPSTGLPAPIVAAATAAGLAVIRQPDATVVTSSYTGFVDSPTFSEKHLIFQRAGAEWGFLYADLDKLTAGFVGFSAITNWSAPSVKRTGGPKAMRNSMVATRGTDGVCLTKLNPAMPGNSMVAYIDNTHSSGWQVGDIRGAWLADTVAEVIAASNKVTNSNFGTGDLSSINSVGGCTLSVVSGRLRATKTAATYYGEFYFDFDGRFVPGRTYTVTFEYLGGNYAHAVGVFQGGPANKYVNPLTDGGPRIISATFVADVGGKIGIVFSGQQDNTYAEFDLIEIREADPDRSVKAQGLTIHGSITKAPVAAGAQLVAYSGFSAANYLQQSYLSALDFGTGDLSMICWVKDGTSYIAERAKPGVGAAAGDFSFYINAQRRLGFIYQNVVDVDSGMLVPAGWAMVGYMRRGGKGYFIVNDRVINDDRGAGSALTDNGAALRIGGNVAGTVAFTGAIALFRLSATAPSDDQVAQMYRTERENFQPDAKCTIAGNLAQYVNSIAYDDATELLHVGTDYAYRSAFKGLRRVESEWVNGGATGPVIALSAFGGSVLVGCGQAAHYQHPAVLLRDELRRRRDARQAMAAADIPLDFDGVAAQTLFPLPVGFTVKGVFVGGTKKRRGATKDFTVTSDGYRETVVFGVSPGATWVQITANRSM